MDLGCGIEFFFYDGLKDFKRVGLDLAYSSFERSLEYGNPAENESFINADAVNLPFKDGVFDIVISSNSFDHIPEPEKCISEVHRVLKNNGKFILCVPRNLKGGKKSHIHIQTIYTTDKIRHLTENYFNIEKTQNILFLYSVLWEKVLFGLNLVYSLSLKIKNQKRIRHLYETSLYRGFSKNFSDIFNFMDDINSAVFGNIIQCGYLALRLGKK